MAGPAVLFGAVAKATNWNETGYGKVPRALLPGESGEDDSRSQFNKKTYNFIAQVFLMLVLPM